MPDLPLELKEGIVKGDFAPAKNHCRRVGGLFFFWRENQVQHDSRDPTGSNA